MRPLVWLRADLRTHDNSALHLAAAHATRGVIAAFLPAPTQWRSHDWGDPKACFTLRAVESLSRDLARLNIPLLIRPAPRFADAPAVLEQLCREHQCDALYFNKEHELNERRRDDEVQRRLSPAVAVHALDDKTLIPPGNLRTGEGRIYTVFTPFKKAALARLETDNFTVHPAPRPQPALPCQPDPPPDTHAFNPTTAHADLWPATEHEAKRRLAHFLSKHIHRYHTDRDFPALDATSTLSPYLSAGLISPRQCLAAAMEAARAKPAARKGADSWISELLWRDFYRHLIAAIPRLSMGRPFRPETEHLDWTDDSALLDAWKQGQTGVPIVDAAMRQLAATGWMHNRCRMITAMYLTKTLFISWREGEQHFMHHLVDADLAQNNGGWQWAASTGTDAAPYFRIFNYNTQAQRFDPQAQYIRRWLPELAKVPTDAILNGNAAEFGYPPPIIDTTIARQRTLAAFAALRS
jgi:deoxyribodipyrimidine photo-lyase